MTKPLDSFCVPGNGDSSVLRGYLLVAVVVLITTLLPAAAQEAPAPKRRAVNDSRTGMIGALRAAGPHPSLGSNAQLFDHFVGTWDFDCVYYAADGTVARFPGEWIFGWVLDGRALQDVWIGYQSSRQPGERGIGTTLRFYDAKAGLWHVIFVVPGPSKEKVLTLQGGAEGDRIVLKGDDADGSLLRWSFNEIRENSFLWRGETSADGGKTWRTEQLMYLKRRVATPSR
jgi:hypothetical protein